MWPAIPWDSRCLPWISMDYANLQCIKDRGFHYLHSQAALNKMIEHVLNPGDLLIHNA